jgi:hypothetical protein
MHTENATSHLASTDRVEENLCDGENQTNCKTKPCEKGVADIRTGWRVVLAGGRSIRVVSTDRGYTVPEYLSASGNLPRRGRTLRREPGDVLRLRQGKCREAAGRPAIGLVALRLRRRLRRMRLARLRRLRGLRRLLLVVGTLPPLLRARVPTPSKDMICRGRVLLDPASTCLRTSLTTRKHIATPPQPLARAAGLPGEMMAFNPREHIREYLRNGDPHRRQSA